MEIPFAFHRFIIGTKGAEVRKMMDEYDVNISIPPAMDNSDVVRISGTPGNVVRAKEALEEKVCELEEAQKDKVRKYLKD